MINPTVPQTVTVNLRLTWIRIHFQEITSCHGEVGIRREALGVNVWEGHASRLVSSHLVVTELVNPRIQCHGVLLLAPEHWRRVQGQVHFFRQQNDKEASLQLDPWMCLDQLPSSLDSESVCCVHKLGLTTHPNADDTTYGETLHH